MFGSELSKLVFDFQAVFVESVLVMSKSTRSKKLSVKGGFYSKEDMSTELGYKQTLNSRQWLCSPVN